MKWTIILIAFLIGLSCGFGIYYFIQPIRIEEMYYAELVYCSKELDGAKKSNQLEYIKKQIEQRLGFERRNPIGDEKLKYNSSNYDTSIEAFHGEFSSESFGSVLVYSGKSKLYGMQFIHMILGMPCKTPRYASLQGFFNATKDHLLTEEIQPEYMSPVKK